MEVFPCAIRMKLVKLLSPEQIIADLEADEHRGAIAELVDRLVTCGLLAVGVRDATLEALREREQLVSTGIGGGVAIPHAFSDEVEKVVAVLGRSMAGIDFEAVDCAPVHVVVLFVVPRKNYQLHLRTLAAIAKMFNGQDITRRILGAGDCDEILAILGSKSSRVEPPKS
jgi:mannitol/fructose-specific phosphotransferase system IIA component (Ntr-type)